MQERLLHARHLIIVSCGTSYYAGLFGRYVIETLTDLTVETELASEFRYRKLNIRRGNGGAGHQPVRGNGGHARRPA